MPWQPDAAKFGSHTRTMLESIRYAVSVVISKWMITVLLNPILNFKLMRYMEHTAICIFSSLELEHILNF